MILSIAIPMVTHGIYDFLVMSGSGLLIIIWFAFLVFMYIYSMRELGVNRYIVPIIFVIAF